MKVMENFDGRTTTVSGGCVVYCLNVTSTIKIMLFKLTDYCRLRSKDGKFKPRRRRIQAKKEKNAKFMALQRQMESSQQRQMRLQDISAHKNNLFIVGDTWL